MAHAVNDPKGLEDRRTELRFRLTRSGDPRLDIPKWTPQEMKAAGQNILARVLADKTPAMAPP